MLKIIPTGVRRGVRHSSSRLADGKNTGQSLSISLNEKKMKTREEDMWRRSTPWYWPGKQPAIDFPRRITSTLPKLNSLDAPIPAAEYRGIPRSSEQLLSDQLHKGRRPIEVCQK